MSLFLSSVWPQIVTIAHIFHIMHPTSTLIYRSESQSSIGLLLTSIKLTYKSYTFLKSIFPLCILRSRDRQREGETRRRGKTKGGDSGRGAESHEGDSEGRGDR
jgi:hypothetical protein